MPALPVSEAVSRALTVLVERGDLVSAGLPDGVVLERVAGARGDYATNLPLRVAAASGRPPLEVAERLAEALRGLGPDSGLAGVEVAAPGFVNLVLDPGAVRRVVAETARAGRALGPGERLPVARPSAGLVSEVGADAAAYAVLRRPSRREGPEDRELFARQTEDNPLFLVRYAHASAAALLRHAADLGVGDPVSADLGLLTDPREDELLRTLAHHALAAAEAAERDEPHRLCRQLEETAELFQRFRQACPPLPLGDHEVTGLHRARLVLVAATRVTLRDGLAALGLDAPDRI